MRTRIGLLGAVVLPVLVAAGCGLLPGTVGPDGVRYPEGCAALDFTERRCRAIVETMAEREGIALDSVAEVRLLPEPMGRRAPVTVRFVLAGVPPVDATVFCGGVTAAMSILCSNDPPIMIIAGVDRDVPCAGEPPDGCATPLPSPEPDALGAARALRIDALDIPINRLGAYEVELGEAVLPNGLRTESTLTLADPAPDDVALERGLRLVVRSLEDLSALGNVYEHGWQPGVERVAVSLEFVVTWFEPGAVLEVRDVVVR